MKEDRLHVLVAYWRPYANAGGMETIEIANLLEQHQTQIKPTYAADFHGARRRLFDDRTIDMLITSAMAYDLGYNARGLCRNFTGEDFAKEVRYLFPTMPLCVSTGFLKNIRL